MKYAMLKTLAGVALAVASLASPAVAQETGLFIGCYQVGGDKPGAPTAHLNLAFNAPKHTVSGVSLITQATNPPLHLGSSVTGAYSIMTVMPKKTHIQVRLSGSSDTSGSNQVENLDLVMVLDDDWSKGTANYKYRTELSENWTIIDSAPAKKVDCTMK